MLQLLPGLPAASLGPTPCTHPSRPEDPGDRPGSADCRTSSALFGGSLAPAPGIPTLSPGLPSPPEPEGPYLQRPSGSNCHLPRKTGATFQGVLASQKQSPRLLTPGSFTCPGPQAKRWLCGPAPLEPLSQGPTRHTDDPHGRANPGLDDPRAYQRTSARLQPDFPSPSPPCAPTPMTQLPNLPASGRSVSLGLCLVLIPQAPLIGTGGKKEQSLAQVIRQVPFTYPPSYPSIQHLPSIQHQ